MTTLTTTDVIATSVFACYVCAALAFAFGRAVRSVGYIEALWGRIVLGAFGALLGWCTYRVAIAILWNAMGGTP